MNRALFLISLAAAATMTLTSLRAARRRQRRQLSRGAVAGQCADHRRTLRWSGYTAADFS
jgi:hypothetical protein